MKIKLYFPVYILLSAVLIISKANQVTRYALPQPSPNFPTNHFDDNIFYDPRFNQYALSDIGYFESRKVPTTHSRQENVGVYGNNNQMFKNPANAWRLYTVNGQNQEVPQTPILKEPLVFPSRGFPIDPVNFNTVTETRHEIPTEVPVNAYDISFGPSASHVATAPLKIKHKEPLKVFPKDNSQNERGDFNIVGRLGPEQVIEVTTHKRKEIENIAESTTTKVNHVSTSTIPPVPTLSPWLDGFGK